MTTPQLLTVNEVCAALRFSRPTFYREVAAGRLRMRKIGSSTRVDAADVQAYIDDLPSDLKDTSKAVAASVKSEKRRRQQ